jgi:aromatic-L-amino-acid/L-tryptophan decarboxylase
MELSRRFRALKLWLSLRYHGLQAFRAAIQRDLDHAQRLVVAIEDAPALECLRVCIVNHRTRDMDIDAVVPEVLDAASEILSEQESKWG